MVSVAALIEGAFHPGHFFTREDLSLVWLPPVHEEIAWEIFRGRLLDPAHSRQKGVFISWNIFQIDGGLRSAEPILSVKLDEKTGQIHVVRAILSHVWVGFDAGNNVIESREQTQWVRELVGTISIDNYADEKKLADELKTQLLAAVEGASRLPLNSVEAPLPAFSLGQLAYLPQPGKNGHRPLRTWQELATIAPLQLETLLRTMDPQNAPSAVERCLSVRPEQLHRMFNKTSLSPYTSFVDNTLAFVKALFDAKKWAVEDEIDLWSWLLRQLCRHLTAYDLITFHFRGANYPDALLLDVVLERYLHLIEMHTGLFSQAGNHEDNGRRRIRRRALRQACLLRRYYEGHPVPDAPTSPGENARVLPPPFVRVPEEQLLNVLRRKKRLYVDKPLHSLFAPVHKSLLRESFFDLTEPAEWHELGSAIFVDRPFGWGKAVGEPDLTPLLAHEAYSAAIARRRFQECVRLAQELNLEAIHWDLFKECLPPKGIPAAQLAEPDRPIVSLADAKRVAEDFVIVRTYSHGPERPPFRLVVRLKAEDGQNSVLAYFDDQLKPLARPVIYQPGSQGC